MNQHRHKGDLPESTDTRGSMETFVAYTQLLKGDEKGEAQVFCDRLFQAFGHKGYKEAGAELESRQKRKDKGTRLSGQRLERISPQRSSGGRSASK
jgi:hypothetical protein